MKKILWLCLLIALSFYSCRRDLPKENSIHAKFTDLKGQPISETGSGELIKIVAAEFSNQNPNNLNSNLGQLYFDNIPVPIEQFGIGFIIVRVPVMFLADYKLLSIYFRLNQYTLRIIERITYRPRVTSEIFAGFGTSAPDGSFMKPAEMTIDAAGNLYVIDQRAVNDVIVKITPAGTTSVFAGAANEFGRLVGIGLNTSQTFLIVSDATAQQVKKISMSSPTTITVLAGSGTAGNVDGTGLAASFRFGTESVDNFGTNELGQGLTVDAGDNVYVGEKFGTTFGGRLSQVRKISAAGVVTTVAPSVISSATGDESFHSPAGLTINSTGEIFYLGGTSGLYQGVARVNATTMTRLAGRISFESFADGTGTAVAFTYPKAIQFFGGLYYIADGSNGALRQMDGTGKVITLAGVGHFETPSFCGCGPIGLPTGASYLWPSIFDSNPNRYILAAHAIKFDQVGGIAVRSPNLMYLSDYGNSYRLIWKIRIE